ncbi:hypothetical protein K2Z83_01030 [Oscillochloris sp. ZM17-4]|uniref:hypothetical protein n=1 Tax=Oscillochloris sp. ZM17-4 TaxID=2866714 RepID=UPI001C731469|nr:hypothetical protein [Oscillochloris sp. ZM17-4]MBX0326277.1 hypothetical protein [Oscillochloris sp. ZM17-4]
MLAVIETFLAGDTILLRRAAVSARLDDFTADLAQSECALYERAGLTVDCSLVRSDWTAYVFRDQLLAAEAHYDILAIQSHASHLWLGSDGEFIYAQDLISAEVDLSRALLISTGCHAGLNVPPYQSHPALDLVQAALGRRANMLGGTSYGVVSKKHLRWSEALILRFEQILLSGAEPTPGRALAAAKADYHRETYDDGDTLNDAKASLQLVFYGLPMYRYVVLGGAGT